MTSSVLGPVRPTRGGAVITRGNTSLYSEILKRVRDDGLLARDRGFYIATFTLLCVALGGLITGFILLGDSWFQLLIAAGLGLVSTQFAFLAHEAAHRQIFDTAKANDWVGRIIGSAFVGMSYSWWMNKHSRHHTKPNTVGHDPDIAIGIVSFVREEAVERTGFSGWFVRHQGYLLFPLLMFMGLDLHRASLEHLIKGKRVEHRWLEIALIVLRVAGVATAVFLVLPLGMAFAFMGVSFAVFGVYMGGSFAPNHKGMPILPHDSTHDFFTRQVITGRNVRGFGMTGLLGGLNYQVEHHLFPNMARRNLKKVTGLVREYCRKHDIVYTETTLIQSWAAVIRYMNRVGRKDLDPFDCPVTSRYRLHQA